MSPRLTRAQLLQFDGATVDDLIGPGVRLLFVGINPGLWTAAVNAHFARRGNRFWPALHRAGILPRLVDASDGMTAADRDMVVAAGIGITNLVPRASARADELTTSELREGGRLLVETVARVQPTVVAMLGLTAFRQAFDRKALAAQETAAATQGTQRPIEIYSRGNQFAQRRRVPRETTQHLAQVDIAVRLDRALGQGRQRTGGRIGDHA